jgi:hypothetical protein
MAISLQSIKRNTVAKAPIVLVHSGPGVGKTTFAACAPNPIFILTEEGLGNLQVDHFPLASSYQEVISAMEALLTEEHDFRWLVIDSLSAMEELVWKHAAQVEGKEHLEQIPYGKGYVIAVDYWLSFFQGLQALRNKGMGIILIAHSQVTRFEAPDMDSYDRYTISLDKRAISVLHEKCDVIGFAQHKVLTRKEEKGFNQKVTKGIGTGERLLHLSEKPAWVAKNRFNMPETIPLLWESFQQSLTNQA